MGTVTVTAAVAGNTITAAFWNNTINAILNQLNGNVEAVNIASGTITATQLASGAVTGPKIAMGSDAQGDILYYNGSQYTRLGPGTSGQFLKTQGAAANPVWATAQLAGQVIAMQKTINLTSSTINTALPKDDTIPQITEGGSLAVDTAITPVATTDRLIIIVIANASPAAGQNTTFGLALFQDATANALCAAYTTCVNNATGMQTMLIHEMAAGTTSATTFRARLGSAAGDTITIDGEAAARIYGGVLNTAMLILEVKA